MENGSNDWPEKKARIEAYRESRGLPALTQEEMEKARADHERDSAERRAQNEVIQELAELGVDRSDHPVFDRLPGRYEQCRTAGERELHLQRVALRLKERYSHHPFYAKAAEGYPDYWRDMASSAVNA